MKEQLLEKIEYLYSFYTDYYSIFLRKEKEVKKKRDKLNKIDEEDIPTPEEVQSLFVDSYVDLTIFSQDLQIIYTKLAYYIDLYVELFQEELSSEISEFYKNYKAVFPKISFIMKNGNLTESEDGLLEAKREEFLNSDTYKQLIKALS